MQKQIAIDILQKGLVDGDRAFADEHIAPNYIQHNPHGQNGREGFVAYSSYLRNLGLPLKVDVRRALQDGDLVAVHSVFHTGDDRSVTFDLFRFDGDTAVEHWDCIEPWVEKTVSGRSMVDGPSEPRTDVDREASRKVVLGFAYDVLVGGDASALPSYVGSTYHQHNHQIGDGLDGLGAFFRGLAQQGVSLSFKKVHRSIAEGDFVLTHSEGEIGGKPTAFCDLFRVSDGKLAEHWDTVQTIPDQLPHANGMF